LHDLNDKTGIAALCTAMGSPFEPTGVAHLPAGIGSDTSRTVIRIEGFADQINYRSGELSKMLAAFGSLQTIQGEAHGALWQSIRDAVFLTEPQTAAVWRVSVAPTKGAQTVAKIGSAREIRHFYDWSGGLVWLATSEDNDAGADVIQSTAAAMGGHATLVRGSDALRATIPVFQPQASALMKLQDGVKTSFDPDRVLNPGRMVAGI
jgi:glycolate oxidase FAD binding subunit